MRQDNGRQKIDWSFKSIIKGFGQVIGFVIFISFFVWSMQGGEENDIIRKEVNSKLEWLESVSLEIANFFDKTESGAASNGHTFYSATYTVTPYEEVKSNQLYQQFIDKDWKPLTEEMLENAGVDNYGMLYPINPETRILCKDKAMLAFYNNIQNYEEFYSKHKDAKFGLLVIDLLYRKSSPCRLYANALEGS